MAMYKYYAVIEKEEGSYIVSFPDLENVFTDADTLPEAVEQAEDVLSLMLTEYEDKGKVIPPASSVTAVKHTEGANLVLIEADTDEYRNVV